MSAESMLTGEQIGWYLSRAKRLEDLAAIDLLGLDEDLLLNYVADLREELRFMRTVVSESMTQNFHLTAQLDHARRELRRRSR